MPTITVANPLVERYLGLQGADFRTISRKSGVALRKMGYIRKYSHLAWERGFRWYAPGSSIPLSEISPAHVLGSILVNLGS